MKIQNRQLTDSAGNPATVQTEDGTPAPLTAFQAAFAVLWTMPAEGLTLGDSEQARAAITGMRRAEQNGGVWDADQALHDWTLDRLRDQAPRVWGVNAIGVVEAFEA